MADDALLIQTRPPCTATDVVQAAIRFCIAQGFEIAVVDEGSGHAPYRTIGVRASDLLEALGDAAGVDTPTMVRWLGEAKAKKAAAEQLAAGAIARVLGES